MLNKYIVTIITVLLLTGLCIGCYDPHEKNTSSSDTMTIRSDNLHEGVWDDVISNTSYGQNHSPALLWDPIDGAVVYAVYMIDTTANNWLHWKSSDISSTSLPEGYAPSSEYVGPYPPSGTHTYEVYVLALKAPVKNLAGNFDAANPDLAALMAFADTDREGNTGNIIATGHISGTFSHKD